MHQPHISTDFVNLSPGFVVSCRHCPAQLTPKQKTSDERGELEPVTLKQAHDYAYRQARRAGLPTPAAARVAIMVLAAVTGPGMVTRRHIAMSHLNVKDLVREAVRRELDREEERED
jgi:hypothetical protein